MLTQPVSLDTGGYGHFSIQRADRYLHVRTTATTTHHPCSISPCPRMMAPSSLVEGAAFRTGNPVAHRPSRPFPTVR